MVILLIPAALLAWTGIVAAGWNSGSRREKIILFLAGLLPALGTGWLLSVVTRLQSNWDVGFAFRKELLENISRFDSGTLSAFSVPDPGVFPWTLCAAGVPVILALYLLSRNRRGGGVLILVLLAPLLLCGAYWRDAHRRYEARLFLQKDQALALITNGIFAAQKKGVPKPLISALLKERAALYGWTYENPTRGRDGMFEIVSALCTLPERAAVQQAKEVLKRAECICSAPSERPEIEAVHCLLDDADRNGPEELVRLARTAKTNEGKLYALALLCWSDMEKFRLESLAMIKGIVNLEIDGKPVSVSAEEIRRNPNWYGEPPFSTWFSEKPVNRTE